jgi:hypothetical protein
MCNYKKEKYDIIILAGQSNAEGYGVGGNVAPWQVDDRIDLMTGKYKAEVVQTAYGNDHLDLQVFDEYKIEIADERLQSGCRLSFLALPFAREYAKTYLKKGRKILIIQTAIGGTGFAKHHWGVEDILFKRMMRMTAEALSLNEENKVVAILWHQGEHDAFENAEWDDEKRNCEHIKNLNALIANARKTVGSVPFICAGFTKAWVEQYPKQNQAILSAMKTVCESVEKAMFIEKTDDLSTNDDLVKNGDSVHFSRDSIEILGGRYFKAYQALQKE